MVNKLQKTVKAKFQGTRGGVDMKRANKIFSHMAAPPTYMNLAEPSEVVSVVNPAAIPPPLEPPASYSMKLKSGRRKLYSENSVKHSHVRRQQSRNTLHLAAYYHNDGSFLRGWHQAPTVGYVVKQMKPRIVPVKAGYETTMRNYLAKHPRQHKYLAVLPKSAVNVGIKAHPAQPGGAYHHLTFNR